MLFRRAMLAVLLLGPAACNRAPAPAASTWPALPKSGFVRGRVATLDDVKKGDAVFAIPTGSVRLNMTIPQYAYRVDGNEKQAGIIVQAEEVPHQRLVGFRPLGSGKAEMLGIEQVELLGKDPPPGTP